MTKVFALRIGLMTAVLVVIVAACAPHAAAQGCAMCYQSAAASGAQGSQALRHGILILLFPTLSVFLGIFAMIVSRSRVPRRAKYEAPQEIAQS